MRHYLNDAIEQSRSGTDFMVGPESDGVQARGIGSGESFIAPGALTLNACDKYTLDKSAPPKEVLSCALVPTNPALQYARPQACLPLASSASSSSSALLDSGSPKAATQARAAGLEHGQPLQSVLEDLKKELLLEIRKFRDEREQSNKWLDNLRTQIVTCVQEEGIRVREKNFDFWEPHLSEQLQVVKDTRAGMDETLQLLRAMQRNAQGAEGEPRRASRSEQSAAAEPTVEHEVLSLSISKFRTKPAVERSSSDPPHSADPQHSAGLDFARTSSAMHSPVTSKGLTASPRPTSDSSRLRPPPLGPSTVQLSPRQLSSSPKLPPRVRRWSMNPSIQGSMQLGCRLDAVGGVSAGDYVSEGSECESKKMQITSDVMAFQAAHGWIHNATTTTGNSIRDSHNSLQVLAMAGISSSKCAHRLQAFSMVLILANLAFMGLDLSFAMDSLQKGVVKPSWVDIVELTFAVAFVIELGVRIGLEGVRFFIGPNWRWNVFDFVLGVSPLLDIIASVSNLSFLRSVKAFRMLRAARMIKGISFVRELRLMVASILCSIVSLLWAIALVMLMVYTYSLFIMQSIHVYGVEKGLNGLHLDTIKFYGTLMDTMLSLFMAISGGIDWNDLLAPLQVISPWYAVSFVFYIVFVLFGVMNILTAIFVSSAGEIANIDRDLVIQETIARDNSTINSLKRVFCAADETGTGLISKPMLERVLEDSETLAYLKIIGLDCSETRGLFQLLDIDDQDYVEIEEFVCGMMRLKGTGVDIATVMYENKRILTRLTAFMRFVEDHMNRLERPNSTNSVDMQDMQEYLNVATMQSKTNSTIGGISPPDSPMKTKKTMMSNVHL